MNKLIQHIVNNPIKSFLFILVLQGVFIANMKVPKIDGSFDSIGIASTGYMSKLKKIDSVFNHEKLIFIEIIPKSVTVGAVLSDCKKIEQAIKENLPKADIKSLHTAEKLFFTSSKQKEKNIFETLKKLTKISLFKDIISKDSNSFLLLVNVANETKTHDFSTITDKILAADYPAIQNFHVVSPWHIEKGVAATITSDLKHITGWILLAFSIIVVLFYKSYKAVIYIVTNMIFTIIPTLLLLGIYGYNLNMIIVLIIPIVSILALADSIHILTAYMASKKLDFKEKLSETYSKYIIPSFLTSLTTAIAFYSLLFNSTESIAMLGLITGHIVLISFFLCYLASPFLLKVLNPKGKISPNVFKIPNWLKRHQKPISGVLVGVFITALFLFNSLSYKNNFEIFLPKNAKVTVDHDAIKHHFYSQSTIDVMLEFKEKDKNNQKQIIHFVKKFKKLESVRLVNSSLKMKYLSLLNKGEVDNPYSKNGGLIQLINLKVDNPNSIKEVATLIQMILDKENGFEYTLSSPTLVFNEVNDAVSKSLLQSVFISMLLLFFIFILLTKSLKKGLIGIFVNIIPLASIVLIFVIFDFHINMLTAITGVVAIGLIVDDTIHVFYRKTVLKHLKQEELGFGIVATTTILFVSFISFTISDFTPTATFGLIAAIVFVVALISDLALLPYLLNLQNKKDEESK